MAIAKINAIYFSTEVNGILNELIDAVNENEEQLSQHTKASNMNFTSAALEIQELRVKVAALELVLEKRSRFPEKEIVEGSWEWALERLKKGEYVRRKNYQGSLYLEEEEFYLFNPFGDDISIEVESYLRVGEWEIDEDQGSC